MRKRNLEVKEPPLRIVRRTEWAARRPRYQELLHCPVPYVILKFYTYYGPCETDEECKEVIRELQRHHKKNLNYSDLAYNFLIGGNGVIYKGRGWRSRAENHTDKYKWFDGKSLEIAFIGDFTNTRPPLPMTQAVRDLIDFGVTENLIDVNHKIIKRID